MLKKLCLAALPLLLASGCTSTEPFEEQIRAERFRADSAEQSAEQATVDKRLAEQELSAAQADARVLKEKLAIAYDALREARARLDEGLQDRLTQLSESTNTPGERLSISQYGGVVLTSGVLFAPGSHELSAKGRQALTPLMETLSGSEYDGYDIELAGHTDSDPIKRTKGRYRDNWDLASMRANSVRRFLIESGMPAERIYLSSWGSIHPIDANDKASNRRVEIMLRKQSETLPASASKQDN
jgi:chemotaxis protein MotB